MERREDGSPRVCVEEVLPTGKSPNRLRRYREQKRKTAPFYENDERREGVSG